MQTINPRNFAATEVSNICRNQASLPDGADRGVIITDPDGLALLAEWLERAYYFQLAMDKARIAFADAEHLVKLNSLR